MTTNAILGSQFRGQSPLQPQERVNHSEITASINSIFEKFCEQDAENKARIDQCCHRLDGLSTRLGISSEKVHQLVTNTLKNHSFHQRNCWMLYYSIYHQAAVLRKKNPRHEDEVSTAISKGKMTQQQIVNMVCLKQLQNLEKISTLASMEEFEAIASDLEKGNNIVLTENDLKKNFSVASYFYQEESSEIFKSDYKINT